VALIDRHPRTADAIALTKCHLLVLDRRDFLPVVMEEPPLALRLLEVLSARLRRTTQQVEDISFGNLSSRLASILIRLAEIQGTISDQAPAIHITQKELGQMIGVSRETANHYLQEWKRAGYLDLKKGACVIQNKTRLKLLASTAAEQDL
jgi:CRP-like cAMP-binding protein